MRNPRPGSKNGRLLDLLWDGKYHNIERELGNNYRVTRLREVFDYEILTSRGVGGGTRLVGRISRDGTLIPLKELTR